MTGEGRVYREKELDRTKKVDLVAGRVDMFPVSGEWNFTFFTSRA